MFSFLPGADITSVEPNIIPERGKKGLVSRVFLFSQEKLTSFLRLNKVSFEP